MSQRIPIYIPTFINSAEYSPVRVLPHVYFFNRTLQCERYYIQDENGSSREQNAFPYFDNYNVVSGSFPTTDSLSLLFNNELAVYGEIPTDSLYTSYWEAYISLLYNPYTRLVNASAIIPLADYFKMELNDIVNFKGNYYHLRAINDYSIKTGECNIQLLGPIGSNEFSTDFINTPRTTTTLGPTTTTTTISGSTTTTTLATTTTTAGTTSTTTFGPSTKVVAHNCQDFYDFNTYCVQQSSTPAIGDVYRDSYGTCYTITSIPSDQTLPCVGNLYLVGGEGSCSSSACVTTTTTEAPFCHTWLVENNTGAGYYFKYIYCGQNQFTYLEVDPNDSVTVCVQNDKIFNSFLAPLTFTDLGTDCIGTTTTTTTIPPQVLFTAASCTDIYDFQTYSANSASYNVGDVFTDDFGTCYYILNFSGEAAVARLTFVGASGSCSSPSCVTTTTTQAPFCNTWQVENPFGASYYYKVKYCGDNFFSYPEINAFSSSSVCVQNNQIENAFGAPIFLTDLSQSCQTTTTTTLAPGCSTFVITNNNIGVTYIDDYVYCGASVSSSYGVGSGETITLCVQDGKINLPTGRNYVINISGSCNATTTTTTTIAPGCYLATIINNNTGTTFLGDYVYCGSSVSQSFEVASGTSASFCTQDKKIDLPSGPSYTSSFSAVGGCISTTTTTTTLAPGCYLATIINNNIGTTFLGEYVGCGEFVSQSYSVGSGTSRSFCTQDKKIELPSGPNYTSSFSAVGGCTTTSTTTTTTAGPFCNVWTASNAFGAGYEIRVKYCGDTSYSFPTVPANSSIYLCVQNNDIDNNGNPILLTSSSVACSGSIITTTTTTAGPTTTTTTTAAPTTTTTTTLSTKKYLIESCEGPADITAVVNILNAPTLVVNQRVHVVGGFAGLYCYRIANTNPAPSTSFNITIDAIYPDCESCPES